MLSRKHTYIPCVDSHKPRGMPYTRGMFTEKDKLLAGMQTRKTLLMMEGSYPASVLYGEIQKVIKFLSGIPKGEPGKTPARGKDYFTEADIKAMTNDVHARIRQPADGKTPLAGTDFPSRAQVEGYIRSAVAKIKVPEAQPGYSPQRGIDYWTDADVDIMANDLLDRLSPGAVRNKLAQLSGDDRLDARYIKNLPESRVETRLPEISLFGGRRASSGGGTSSIQVTVNGNPIGQDIKRLDFAGAGVVVERVGDGNAIVTIAGGGSGASIATEKVTAVESGANVTIDLTQLSHTLKTLQFVTRNGQVQPPVASAPVDGSSGYSVTGTVVTVYNADPTETYLICYGY